jgi:hypothetical protein
MFLVRENFSSKKWCSCPGRRQEYCTLEHNTIIVNNKYSFMKRTQPSQRVFFLKNKHLTSSKAITSL